MQADLVSPPGLGERAHQRGILQPPLDSEACSHRLDSGRPLGYARQRAPDLLDRVDAEAPVGAAPVTSFDGERLLERDARAYTEVFLVSQPVREGSVERRVDRWVLRAEQDAG